MNEERYDKFEELGLGYIYIEGEQQVTERVLELINKKLEDKEYLDSVYKPSIILEILRKEVEKKEWII